MTAEGYVLRVHGPRRSSLAVGATGLRVAVELKRRDVDVIIASQSAFGGTSACSGSEKRTLHTANSARTIFRALAEALGDGRAMDGRGYGLCRSGPLRSRAIVPSVLDLPPPQVKLGGRRRLRQQRLRRHASERLLAGIAQCTYPELIFRHRWTDALASPGEKKCPADRTGCITIDVNGLTVIRPAKAWRDVAVQ